MTVYCYKMIFLVNPLSVRFVIRTHENTSVSESETTSASNWKVISTDEDVVPGARWIKVSFTLALKGSINVEPYFHN